MGKSNSYYMQLHVEALFTMNEKPVGGIKIAHI